MRNIRGEPNHEPLVLIGHSYGADDVIRIAHELNEDQITVDLLVTLDPVTPPTIPPNVKRCVNIYQSNGAWDTLPWLHGVPVEASDKSSTVLANYNVKSDRKDLYEPNVDHFNIEKKKKVHDEVIRHVLVSCPPREQWVMRNIKPMDTTGCPRPRREPGKRPTAADVVYDGYAGVGGGIQHAKLIACPV